MTGCSWATAFPIWTATTGVELGVQQAEAGGVASTGSSAVSGASAVSGGQLYVGTAEGHVIAYGLL